ncbi:repressor [Enterococcus devriesei]|uniref:Repressor n=2 Tax=Bacilli TaxID=91061 RepID=A0A1L8SSQ6_9ENTE|nr:repressor [Enterococcus devriesei]
MVTSVFETFEGIDSVEASRHNLTSDPDAFVNNSTILKLLQEKGNDILPVTLLDGEIVKEGSYPTLEEFGKYGAIHFVAQPVNNSGGCCGGNDGSEGCC